MEDRYDLQRFVSAQAPIYKQVVAELENGHKRTHWMWFIFPQIKGLGRSEISRRFAISSLGEATAYLQHPVLGPRLTECTVLVNKLWGHTAYEIFGDPDCMKFHSCMTLFDQVAGNISVFRNALETFFSGLKDEDTISRL